MAVCNPPYIKSEWQASYSELLEEVDLSSCIPVYSDSSADILFLAQNVRLLRNGGELGIIVPDGLITASKMSGIREKLIQQHKLSGVIQLPTRIFKRTEAQTYILILKKNVSSDESIPLYKATTEGVIGEPIFIATEQAKKRLDYDHYLYSKSASRIYTEVIQTKKISKKQPIFEVSRGRITKIDAIKQDINFFHTTDFKFIDNPSAFKIQEQFNQKIKDSDQIIAEKGDILLARVGRDIETKMAYVHDGKIVLTDCIYRIRAKDPKNGKKIWKYLSSKKGRLWIKSQYKGVCAQSLNKSDLLNLPIK